jgi:predicted XRE-type DNA-binding protein
MSKKDRIDVTEGSGNVFADLGFADPELELLKSTMVQRIASIIRARKLTQVQAAKILGLDQPKVSGLLRGRFGGYSTDRLLRFLTALDQDVQLIVKARPRRAKRLAAISVIAA